MIAKKKKKKKKILPKLLISLLVLLIAGYIGTAVYFMSHVAFNTTVNGRKAFGKDLQTLCQEVIDESDKYTISINGKNNVQGIITASDIMLKPEFGNEFDEIFQKQNAFLWPAYLFSENSYTTDTVVSYSKEKLRKVVDAIGFFDDANVIEPINASITDQAGENGFEIIPENNGCKPIMEKVYTEIEDAVNILLENITVSDECYETAAVKSDNAELNELCNNLNRYCNVYIEYDFGENKEIIDGNRVRQWCTVNGTDVSLNEENIKEFVTNIAKKYDTFGKTRNFKTTKDGEIEVKGGDYGWWMDRSSETKELTEAIKNGEKGVRKPVYFQEAKSYSEKDYGNSYVEINLTDQHLWVYKDGEKVEESDFVSGCVNKKRVTPTGTYSITYKERDATLVGQGYSSPVSYWMPFNGNVGMHDASWRSSFGGDIYITNGSHGCINLPKKKAEAIYAIMEKGYPIIVYGGKTEPEHEEEPTPDPEAVQSVLTPAEQIQQLINAGLLNPDGTLPN